MSLHCCSGDRKYWKSPPLFLHANEEDTFRYRYIVKYKEGLATWLLKKVTFSRSKDEKTIKETNARKLNRGNNQFDIFHHPSNLNWKGSVFSGQLFFVKLLYEELGSGGNFKELLMECEHVGFGHPNYIEEEVKLFLRWVVEMTNNSPTPFQSVYLWSLLGQLVHRVRGFSAWYTCSLLGHKSADLLLSSLAECLYTELPQSTLKFIRSVAEDLFKAGSSTGCLLFIKYFCNLLDVNFVMQVADKLPSRSYTEQQFDQQVPNVLDALKRLKTPANCLRYCSYVVDCSPSVPCLWNLYQLISFCFPALVDSLTEEFSNLYCRFISRSRAKKPDLLQPLYWCQVPDNLKGKLTNPLCKALADQIGSESTWPKERLASLKSIALDASLQSDHFRSFILGVVTHKCKEVVSILSDLLKSKTFCSYWKTNFSWEDKVKVCNHWLTTYFHKAGMNPKDKILSVVEACELLCKTDTLKTDKVLCEAMDKEVHRLVLKTKIESVMDAFKDAQRRAPEIQQRLTLLLRSAIKQQTGTGDCRSRYRQMIHMLGFDVSRERKRDLEKVKLDR